MCDIKEKIGSKIREIRLMNNISQCDLADKSGLHRTYINTVESGKRNITVENLERIARALEVDIKVFFDHHKIPVITNSGRKKKQCTVTSYR